MNRTLTLYQKERHWLSGMLNPPKPMGQPKAHPVPPGCFNYPIQVETHPVHNSTLCRGYVEQCETRLCKIMLILRTEKTSPFENRRLLVDLHRLREHIKHLMREMP